MLDFKNWQMNGQKMNVHLGTTMYPKSISNISLVIICEEKYLNIVLKL